MFLDIHSTQANKGKYQDYYVWNIFWEFVVQLKKYKRTRVPFNNQNKTDLQNFAYTTLPAVAVIHVKINNLHIFVPTIIRSFDKTFKFQ